LKSSSSPFNFLSPLFQKDAETGRQVNDLKQKIFFTLGAVAVYRLCAQIPVWGVNPQALALLPKNNAVLGFLDLFSGGALTSLSVVALGIGPYITASIVIQLLTAVVPRLEEMQKDEGEAGRRQLAQITRYVSVVLALIQSLVVVKLFASNPNVLQLGVEPTVFYVLATTALVAGSLFTLWLSELITEKGIGNGSSMLIFVGILAGLPFYAAQTAQLVEGDPQRSFSLVVLLAIYLAMMVAIIILQEAVRKVFIVQAKRSVGSKQYGAGTSFIPFKINPAGVMPIIFTFALLAFPQTLVGLIMATHPKGWILDAIQWLNFSPGSFWFMGVQFALIIFFSYFYSSINPSMQPKEIATSLKKYGNAIPGVKPGVPTGDYLSVILNRIIFIGAVFLAIITLVASSATSFTGISTLAGLGSTALIIMVGVALDTMNQIKVHLMVKHYEGFLK
jgi:preprotein translocase subunit SecY